MALSQTESRLMAWKSPPASCAASELSQDGCGSGRLVERDACRGQAALRAYAGDGEHRRDPKELTSFAGFGELGQPVSRLLNAGADEQNVPVLVRLCEARRAARSTVDLLRSRVARCEELAPATRQRWLDGLPASENSGWWLEHERARTSGRGL
jgi:hypothetical protein